MEQKPKHLDVSIFPLICVSFLQNMHIVLFADEAKRRYSQCINDCQAQYVPVLLGNYDDYIRMKIIAIVILSDCWAEWKYIKKNCEYVVNERWHCVILVLLYKVS